jgi:hypothetical protein
MIKQSRKPVGDSQNLGKQAKSRAQVIDHLPSKNVAPSSNLFSTEMGKNLGEAKNTEVQM